MTIATINFELHKIQENNIEIVELDTQRSECVISALQEKKINGLINSTDAYCRLVENEEHFYNTLILAKQAGLKEGLTLEPDFGDQFDS